MKTLTISSDNWLGYPFLAGSGTTWEVTTWCRP